MSQFRNLVFEGGGVKGIAYAGAIDELNKQDVLPDICRIAGTSAGAITAALLAVGADNTQIQEIVGGTNFRSFMDDSFGMIGDIKRLIEDYGWFKGDAFSRWMQKNLEVLTENANLTFLELHTKKEKNPDKYRDLYVVATGLNFQMPKVFNYDSTPNMFIWDAVRRSMSIPLFFAAVREGQLIWVDGGLTWNYPIDIFDDLKYVEDKDKTTACEAVDYPTKYNENHVYNKQTLGLKIDTKDEIKSEKEGWHKRPLEINDFKDYLSAIVSFTTEMANKMHLHENDWHRTIYIDAGGVGTTEFDIPKEKIELLIENGKTGVQEYFKWFNDSKSAKTPLNLVKANNTRTSKRKTRG